MELTALMGDYVRTSSGVVGEITKVWGVARTFFTLQLDCGKSVTVMEDDALEIVRRGNMKGRRKAK